MKAKLGSRSVTAARIDFDWAVTHMSVTDSVRQLAMGLFAVIACFIEVTVGRS